jgi:rSAM/selenodomain-associated transferase 2
MKQAVEKTIPSGRIRAEISIILPVLNEADRINAAIGHLQALEASGKTEIIVVDGDPSGSTIREVGDRDVKTATSARGRAIQMNCGAALASGSVLIFLHADTMLPADAISLVRTTLRDPRVQAGAFGLGIASDRPIFRITERYVAIRTRLTRVPFGDQAIFIRRSYFDSLGGFREIPLMEDVDLMKRIRTRGDRISIIPAQVRTSARRWEREGILACTFRNWALQLAFALGVKPERLARWYK